MSGEDLENRGSEKNRANNTYSSSSFFVEDERDAEWTAWLVPLFVVANVVVFMAAMYINNCPKYEVTGKCVASFLGRISFQPLKQNPLFGPSSTTLEKLGGLEWSKVVVNHQRWRLIACIWLHAGLVHLLTNMLSLVLIGIRLEHQFGFVRVGVLYLLSGFGGSLLSCLFIRGSISVGASGALFGLLGAMLSELITNWSIYTNKVAALLTFLFIIVVNLAIGVLPHVDNFAHIGGFLMGFLLGFVLLARPHYVSLGPRVNVPSGAPIKSRYRAHQYVLWLVSLVLLVAGLTLSLMKLFSGGNGNDQCRWCRYLSCVPSSRWTC